MHLAINLLLSYKLIEGDIKESRELVCSFCTLACSFYFHFYSLKLQVFTDFYFFFQWAGYNMGVLQNQRYKSLCKAMRWVTGTIYDKFK